MTRLVMLFAALLALVAAPATANSTAPQVNADASGVAMQGYDPVAFFAVGKPAKGSSKHQLEYHGATWRFMSAEHLTAFKANPDRFVPQFGGYCAWAVSQHYLAPGDPNYWKIVDGKLYLNANARAKELWEADQVAAIQRGHANWPAVLTNNQDSDR